MTSRVIASPAVTVRPGPPLVGQVTVDGSKNAALPLLAAAAATRYPVHLSNVPHSLDVAAMLTLIRRCGYHLARPVGRPNDVALMPAARRPAVPHLPEAAGIRASYYLVPVLLAAGGQAALPWPGGCRIGARGMEQHLNVYAAFGDTVEVDDGGYRVTGGDDHRPREVQMDLPFRSRGTSVVAVLRAVVGGHRLLLGNPNRRPAHQQGLLHP